MNKKTLLVASVFGALAVMLGAWGAHGLKALVNAEAVASFEAGVRYQMYHALFLLGVGVIPVQYLSQKAQKIILYLTFFGVLFFSGSIYFLATNDLTSFFDFRKIVLITPLGGLLLIGAWVVLFFSILKQKK
ncbi:DUF423 domain-containing protein [Capnocytophaga canimorsus]|uniref:DUF423 domain-containing protein n=1 Tax=Capnocytophaga canimorsus TaxID=28188 RepID=UPI001AD0A996|nr:DUF423 domain-containing protein [Capnocytophaga canimorsus]GIM55693.1 membrane protein [Capnocytophaga canimorsus]